MSKMYEDWNKLFCDQMVEEIRKFEKCPNEKQLCVIKDLIEVTNGLQEMEMAGAIRRIAEDRYGYDSSTGRFREMPMEMMGGMGMGGYDPELEFFEMFNASRGGRGGGRGRRRDSRGRFIANMMNAGGSASGGQSGGGTSGGSSGGSRGGQTKGVYNNMPFYPYPPDEYGVDWPWGLPPYMMNDGREFSGDRFESEEERERMKEEREEMMNAGRGGRGGNRSGSSSGNRGGNRSGGRSSGGSSSGRGGRSGGSYNAYPYGDDDEMYMLRQENGMPIMTPYNAHDPNEVPKKLTAEQCKKWMDSMENEDGTDGPKYDKKQVEEAAKKAGIDYQEYGIETLECATNMMYSDYCEIGRKYGVDRPEFWVSMADAFLMDEDFEGDPKTKLSIYFHKIAEHGKQ